MKPASHGPDTDVSRRLRAAQAEAYGPHAGADGARRLRELELELARGRRLPAVRRPARRRSTIALVVVALVAAAIGGWIAGFAMAAHPVVRATPAAVPDGDALARRIAESGGRWSADDYYRRYPDDLPAAWRTDVAAHSFLRLGGGVRLPIRPAATTTALLVVTTCPSSDRMFDWRLLAADGTTVGGAKGRCGRLARTSIAVPAGSGPLTLAIGTAGLGDYAVAVFER